jgi:exosortase/archaeosortase family protein
MSLPLPRLSPARSITTLRKALEPSFPAGSIWLAARDVDLYHLVCMAAAQISGLPTGFGGRIGNSRVVHTVVALALAAVAVTVMHDNESVRILEAGASAWLTGIVTGTRTLVAHGQPTFLWSLGTRNVEGLTVTADCSSAFIVGPTLLLVALLSVGRRLSLSRLLVAAAISAAIAAVCNVGRITMIAWATHIWGLKSGFFWSHVIVGSLVTLAAGILSLWVVLRVAFKAPRSAPRAPGGN